MNDIKVKLKLYLGEKQSDAVQTYESLILVAGQLFGDKKKAKAPRAEDPDKEVVSTKGEIAAKMKEIFG